MGGEEPHQQHRPRAPEGRDQDRLAPRLERRRERRPLGRDRADRGLARRPITASARSRGGASAARSGARGSRLCRPACLGTRRHLRPVHRGRHAPHDRPLVHALHRARRPSSPIAQPRTSRAQSARSSPAVGRSMALPASAPGARGFRTCTSRTDGAGHRRAAQRTRMGVPPGGRHHGTKMPWRAKRVLSCVEASPSGPPSQQLDIGHLPDRALRLHDQARHDRIRGGVSEQVAPTLRVGCRGAGERHRKRRTCRSWSRPRSAPAR